MLHQSTVEELQNSIHAQEEEVKGFEWELDAATADERADLDSRQAKLKKQKGHLALDKSDLEETVTRYQSKADAKTATFVKEKDRLFGNFGQYLIHFSRLSKLYATPNAPCGVIY